LQNAALVKSALQMDFYIYNHLTNGSVSNVLWSTTNVNVDVNQGIYSVFLGDDRNPISPNVFVTDNAYLQVVVGGETLAPRTKINSAGYALQAGGLSAGGVEALTVSTNGNIGIGTTDPRASLQIGGSGVLQAISNSELGLRTNGYYDGTNNRYINASGKTASLILGSTKGDFTFYTSDDPSSGANSLATITSKMYIGNTGNVGIGTVNPEGLLHIYKYGNPKLIIQNVASADNAEASLEFTLRNALANTGTTKITSYTKAGAGWMAGLRFSTMSGSINPRMDITPEGNVGIGTTAPATRLEVAVDGDASNIYNTAYRNNSGQASFCARFARGAAAAPLIVANGDVIGTFSSQPHNGNNFNMGTAMIYTKVNGTVSSTNIPTDIVFGTDAAGVAYSASKAKMVIASSGNVGIGTTNPLAPVHIYSSAAASPTGQVGLILSSLSAGAVVGSGPYLRFDNGLGNIEIGRISSVSEAGGYVGLAFYTHNAGVTSESVRIRADGKVGIGTTNPGAKLDVNGDINYVADATVRRVHNDAASSVKTTGGYIYFGTSWANIDTTYFKVDLPTAGTYLLYGNFRALHFGTASCYAKVRLYNNTDASVVPNSDRMLIEVQNTSIGYINMMTSALWRVSVTAAKTIYLQGYCGAANMAGLVADVNGYDEFGYIRLN
jgi:hypothetical protein